MIADWKSIEEIPNENSLVITKTITQHDTIYCICIFDGNIFYSLETGIRKYPDFWDTIEEYNSKRLLDSVKDVLVNFLSKNDNKSPGLYA